MSGSVLKTIACLAMLLDHIAGYMPRTFMNMNETLFMLGDHVINLHVIMRAIGRIAFPIFAFLITEGFEHTRDRKRYGLNLLAFALISEIPWNLVHSGTLFYYKQNVFFNLFLGYTGLCAIEYFKGNRKSMAISLVLLLITSYILKADFGVFGFGYILLLYLIKSQKILMAIISCCVLPSRLIGGMAFIPILMYNGERGFAKARWTKYAFYLFYPLHLFLIFSVRSFLL